MPPRRRAVLLCGSARALLADVARELAGGELSLVIQAGPSELSAVHRLTTAMRRRGAIATQVVAGGLGGAAESARIIAAAWAAAPGIDTVVVCAGAPPAKESTEPGLDAWRAVLDAGVRASFFLAQQAIGRLARRGGRVVVAIEAPARGGGPVAAVVRAGLLCLVEGLSKAVPERIAVSAVVGASRGGARTVRRGIARGVRGFVVGDTPANGTVLELGAPPTRG